MLLGLIIAGGEVSACAPAVPAACRDRTETTRQPVGASGTLVGQVVESRTGIPIHHAWVHVDENKAGHVFTDTAGQFRLTGVPRGGHVLSVAFIGFGWVHTKFTMPRTQGLRLKVALYPSSPHECGGFAVPVKR